MMELANISLASLSLESSTCADIICGSNGLPLTPNSITIIGNFKARVEHVDHPNLTKYVECFRNKNERITLVFENLPHEPPPKIDFLTIAGQLLDALNHLHNNVACVHGLITPQCIVWSEGNIKLAHWPIDLLTNGGFALGASTLIPTNISFLAPERIKSPSSPATAQADIWSACLSLLKLIKQDCKLNENPCRISFCDNADQVLEHLEFSPDNVMLENPSIWLQFFQRALEPNPEKRATLSELYAILSLVQPVTNKDPLQRPFIPNEFETKQEQIVNLNIAEIYYLWRLSLGRNFESEQKQDDCFPILRLPYFIMSEKQLNQEIQECKLKSHVIIDTRSKLIPLEKFKSDMGELDVRLFHPLILTEEEEVVVTDNEKLSKSKSDYCVISKEYNNNRKMSETFTFADLDSLSIRSNIQTQTGGSGSKMLPIVIKEADFAYQCERVVLFKRLLNGCPYLNERLKQEASIDIPPYYRAQTWAILLGVSAQKSEALYETIDKTTPIATDRQISVDIPRCHQYNDLMASPQGHQKLARVLKAWLNYNSAEYVYWQGLDSLAAPFLLLNFNNEALAFSCFNAFVNKYLRGFFKKDNQVIVHQYLTMFSELLSYHDSSLANHLEKLGFLPNLYAIPWFLTMFTHVLPLHKILHVWDCLLLGDEKFPLCIGLAILNQLRPDLMEYNFNDCIVAFSDLPEIDIERCIRDASRFYNSTPDIYALTI